MIQKIVKRFFATLKYPFPVIKNLKEVSETEKPDQKKFKKIHFIVAEEAENIEKIKPENLEKFKKKHKVTVNSIDYYNIQKSKCFVLEQKQSVLLSVSQKALASNRYQFLLNEVISSTYEFTLKTLEPKKQQPTIYHNDLPNFSKILELSHCRNYARELANQRANVGTPQYFENQCVQLATQCNLGIKVIKGAEIISQRFNLLHAVGRASINQPRVVNLTYKGNPQQPDNWVAFIGKGLCFDSGGLNIKVGNSMFEMHLDKHGSASVLAALRSIANLKLKINLTVTIGYVQNSIDGNAYRPTDILTSRKGLTVEIGNTDAEGRLTLADVMNWTQEVYKPKKMIELSTLTGAIVVALGKTHAGLFSNNAELVKQLKSAAQLSNDGLWEMPILQEHRENIKPKYADLTNSSGKGGSGSSQAAAFLEAFVQKDTQWAHLDIAGTAADSNQATGYGARLLVKFAQLEQKK